jgi:hypothetical protein
MKNLWVIVFFSTAVLAQVVGDAVVTRAFDSSAREIWIYAPKVTHRDQADALRRAIVERGVAVTLLVLPPTLERVCDPGAACRLQYSDKDSYVYGLALAGARLFESRVPNAPAGFTLIDRKTGFEGAGVGTLPPPNAKPTVQVTGKRAMALYTWYLATLSDPKKVRRVSNLEILKRLERK